MKQFVISTGDKGGVGKSTVTALLADYSLSHHTPATLIEGDVAIMDVAPRFKGVMPVYGVDLAAGDSMTEERITSLGETLEGFQDEQNTILLNAPAGLSAAIDRAAPILRGLLDELGYQLVVVWVVGPDEASARMAGESQLLQVADRQIAAVNNPAGRGDAAGTSWVRGGYSKRWAKDGNKEVVIPSLAGVVMDRVRTLMAPYSAIRAGETEPKQSIVSRQYLAEWLRAAEPACRTILGVED